MFNRFTCLMLSWNVSVFIDWYCIHRFVCMTAGLIPARVKHQCDHFKAFFGNYFKTHPTNGEGKHRHRHCRQSDIIISGIANSQWARVVIMLESFQYEKRPVPYPVLHSTVRITIQNSKKKKTKLITFRISHRLSLPNIFTIMSADLSSHTSTFSIALSMRNLAPISHSSTRKED